jgi:hypothetical protein
MLCLNYSLYTAIGFLYGMLILPHGNPIWRKGAHTTSEAQYYGDREEEDLLMITKYNSVA